jgi:hypothetical protein
MAKNTKNPLSEVEIVRRRDGVVDTTEPLDASARRVLADARLRALALTLNINEVGQGGDYPDDAELLAYLLDTLPDQRRHEVELAVRGKGNARAFGRLVALRTAFNTHLDKRDRRRTEHPARKVVRRTAQEVEIRKLGEELRFRDAPSTIAPVMQLARRTSAAAFSQMVSANRHVPSEKRRRSRMRLDSKTGLMLRNYLQRASLPLVTGRHLIEEARSLVAQLEMLNLASKGTREEPRPAGETRVNELEQLSDRLVDVLFRLQRESDQLADDIRRIVLVAIDPPPSDKFSHRSAYVSEADFASDSYPPADFRELYSPAPADMEDSLPGWHPMKQVSAGEWSLLLAGVASPRAILTATLEPIGERTSEGLPVLTLVRPNEGFEVAEVDSAGLHKVNLPPGRSVLLIQGEKEIWQVPLTLREG